MKSTIMTIDSGSIRLVHNVLTASWFLWINNTAILLTRFDAARLLHEFHKAGYSISSPERFFYELKFQG